MGELKRYEGSCHCSKVKFTVDADLSGDLITCNCSICLRTGAVLAFVPASQLHIESGEQALTDYVFNKKVIHHLFCSTCGVRPFARGAMPDGTPIAAINVRCLEGIELAKLSIKEVDGRSS